MIGKRAVICKGEQTLVWAVPFSSPKRKPASKKVYMLLCHKVSTVKVAKMLISLVKANFRSHRQTQKHTYIHKHAYSHKHTHTHILKFQEQIRRAKHHSQRGRGERGGGGLKMEIYYMYNNSSTLLIAETQSTLPNSYGISPII